MPRLVINKPVATGSLIIIFALLLFGGIWPDTADRVFADTQTWVLDTFGWFYILTVAILTVAVLIFAFTRFGSLKLGPDNSTPDFSYPAWISMLFAAGVGIGLMFYGVAEPMSHFTQPPTAEPRSVDAQREAMASTIFHWGINGWAIFAVVGLALGYFGYRYNLPLTIRSALYPLIRDRINGPIGHAVDIFAICGTMFGIATSLGLGVLQMNAGLTYLFDVPDSLLVQVVLIAVVIGIASISVVAGLDAGVRRLSELNMSLAVVLVVFVLAVGPTIFLIQSILENTGLYLGDIVPRTFTMFTYEPTRWLNDWTLFYWGWWISWSPFVGMFIAKISRGRTVREFILGVLLVPTAFIILWMTVFGNSAMRIDTGEAQGALAAAVSDDITVALFQFLEYLPLSNITSGLAIFLIAVFFITSADSGSLVVDTLASGGSEETPAVQRVFWCVLEGAVAAILLVAGGLTALQTATVVSALPFAVVILFLCFGLFRGMAADVAGQVVIQQHRRAPRFIGGTTTPWTRRIGRYMRPPRKEQARQYIVDTAVPALQQLIAGFNERGMEAELEQNEDQVALVISSEGARDFVYGVGLTSGPLPGFVLRGVDIKENAPKKFWMATTYFSDGRRGYNVMGYTQDQLIGDALDQFDLYGQLVQNPESELYITSPEPASRGSF